MAEWFNSRRLGLAHRAAWAPGGNARRAHALMAPPQGGPGDRERADVPSRCLPGAQRRPPAREPDAVCVERTFRSSPNLEAEAGAPRAVRGGRRSRVSALHHRRGRNTRLSLLLQRRVADRADCRTRRARAQSQNRKAGLTRSTGPRRGAGPRRWGSDGARATQVVRQISTTAATRAARRPCSLRVAPRRRGRARDRCGSRCAPSWLRAAGLRAHRPDASPRPAVQHKKQRRRRQRGPPGLSSTC